MKIVIGVVRDIDEGRMEEPQAFFTFADALAWFIENECGNAGASAVSTVNEQFTDHDGTEWDMMLCAGDHGADMLLAEREVIGERS